MGTQQFCLKWNNHQSNMLTVFEQLLSTEALVDVTLACDGLSLKAHKMVLSACSPYFQSLFLENPCKHPIVIMKDMRYTELKAIIDFMYRGEVNVSHDQLNALLRTAETLKVKGLAEVSGENRTAAGMVQQEIVQNVTTPPATGPPPQTRSDSPTLLSKRKRGRPRKRSLSDSNRSDDDQVPSKIKEPGSPEIEELSGDASIEANDISLSSNSQTQVHQSLTSSSVHNSHLNKHPSSIQSSHDSQVEEPPSDDGDFEVEPSKLMEQTLTTDVPVMSNSTPQSTVAPSVHIVPLSSSSGLDVNRSIVPSGSESTTLVPASASIASDSLSSSQMQGPDSPQDIKPALLSFEEPPISPVAGPSQDRSMMMYMDTSGVPAIPGTSYQDNQTAIVQHESQPQGFFQVESTLLLPGNPKKYMRLLKYSKVKVEVQGERTLWWNQRMRLQKLHCGFPKHLKSRNHLLSVPSILKGSARQAVCPFCYKAFYDKSTMNRHVAKRVCLGVAFQQASKQTEIKEVPGTEQTNKQDEVQDVETDPYSDKTDEVHPFSNKTDDVLSFSNKSDDIIRTYSDRTDDLVSESNRKKSNLEPCPYCKKMLKGTRGIRKHLDFYGCPMYPTSENK